MNPKNDWNTSCVLLVFQYVLLIWHMKAMNADGGCTKESKLKTSRKTTQIQHKTRQKSDRIEENASRKLYQKEALVISQGFLERFLNVLCKKDVFSLTTDVFLHPAQVCYLDVQNCNRDLHN